jgi:anaerobic selenocysteine-containing dehydrogenase
MTDTTTDGVLGHRICPLCEAGCGLEIGRRDGRWLIRGDRLDPFSKGFLCPKGTALGALHEDPDRLRSPVIRRGDDPATATWEPVGWDEAFAEIADRLTAVVAAHGREALAVYVGNPNAHSHENAFFLPGLIRSLGTRHVYSASTVDQMPKHVSSGLLFGDPDAIPVPDLDRTDLLLMLGANPLESNGSLCTAPDFPGRLDALRRRGGRLVVVDPRRTRTATIADTHLAIRPGTDAHLLVGLAHVLLRDDLARPGRLAEWCRDLDHLPAAVAPFTPEAVGAVTGLGADAVETLARDLAAAPTAAVYARIGAHTTRFGSLAAWATDVVNVLTGNLDRPGGAMFTLSGHQSRGSGAGRGFTTGRWTGRVGGAPEVRGELPVAHLAEEILVPGPGQVRALFTVAGNPVLSTPDSARLDHALAGLDLMVSVDPWLNETTRRAHVVLPPPGPLARSHYDIGLAGLAVRNIAKWSPALLPHDGPPEWQILARLTAVIGGEAPDDDGRGVAEALVQARAQRVATKLGLDPAEVREAVRGPARSPADELLDLMLRSGAWGDGFGARADGLSLARLEADHHGLDLGPLVPRLPEVLRTTDGRIDLLPAPIRSDLDRLADDLHRDRAGHLVLVGRRHLRSNNSWLHNVPVLVKGRERCTLQVHPDDATRLGLRDGGRALVRSAVGQLDTPVEVTDEIRPGVVSLPHGWGHDLPGVRLRVAGERPGVNSNVLTDPGSIDPLSGTAELNGIPVEVEAVP